MAAAREPGISAEVRAHCARVAARARWVAIDEERTVQPGGDEGLDPELHLLDASPDEVARYVLVLDAINFGSGWFGELRLPPGQTGTEALTRALTAHARARGGTWTASELRRMDRFEVGGALGQDSTLELMELYAAALRQLGAFLGERSATEVVAAAGGSTQVLARALAGGMPYFADAGFYKRAQITCADLAHAGVARFSDIDELTVFADNMLPHVLRLDGVLVYHPQLARRVDAGELLPAGSPMEVELRACAVHACERLASGLGVAPRVLDNWLWNRGERPPYSSRPAHRTHTVFY